jgi:hypothetical protein
MHDYYKARNALSVYHRVLNKHHPLKTQSNIGKTDKYCTNCGMNNHNVETCKKKKGQTIMATMEAAPSNQKPHKTSSYTCHIYGSNKHEMTDCSKFTKMQKMFHGKCVIVAKVQLVVEI